MMPQDYELPDLDIAWCPGCGNFGILTLLKKALAELSIEPRQLVIASGIGQAAKTPHYLKSHVFNGLHGRALPAATAIKAGNPQLTVIAQGGDGDMYGEGGNHFLHAIRRNPDLTHLVHDNMVYGLTKGQASPTSQPGFVTPLQVDGVCQEPFNPLSVAIALNASFVARIYVGAVAHAVTVLKAALRHHGYALVDILQPCVSFNRLNTYEWFEEHCYFLEEGHDPEDRQAAFARACETERLPLGIFYRDSKRKTFEEHLVAYRHDSRPLYQRSPNTGRLHELINDKRLN
ncbi:MAG: thiamine pyrophosphate-dependent enzyme [Syntrophotalea acetylenica]|nr:thiamine pyrophosphate-dependent enzyme [Syntrophotalea acetylenica]